MKVNKTLAVAGILATLGLTSIGGLAAVSAATSTSGRDSLIDKLVSKFNLNKDEVKAVFDEEKTAREAERQAEMSERLQDLVDDGKITVEQKTLIENKQKELQAAREAERADLESWADQNKIDLKYIMFGHRHGDNNDRLQDLVDDGKITADQKALIEKKQSELEDRHEADRDALEQWADDNNIELRYVMGMGGPGGHAGMVKFVGGPF